MKATLYSLALLLLLNLFSFDAAAQVRVFVLAGQSNMQGQGKIYEGSNGAIGQVMVTFTPTCVDPDAESCDFTFNMLDGYGDGWNGWTYDFVQEGNVMATETLPEGSEGSAVITLMNNVSCDVVVNNAGPYGFELSWTLTNSLEEVVASLTGQDESYPSPNTLLDVVENDEEGLWSMLQTNGDWTVLDDAYLHYENGAGDLIRDHVTIGQGAFDNLIGPELMFAHQMDAYFDEPILIIKTAWGGLSLAEDFRPPSAGGTTGPYYLEMMDIVANVTANLATEFPELGTTEFELSGFGWFQGWNDGASEDFLNEYESNLHHLVNDVRNDLGVPELPIVVASSGQGGYEDHWGWMEDIQDIVAVAQENVACDDTLYGGTVGFVDTKPFYMDVLESPDNAGYHFHNNALTFLNVGKSMGDEMILAINNMAYCDGFVSVPETNEQAISIKVYPNPTSGNFTVDLGQQTRVDLTLLDAAGRVLLQEQYGAVQQVVIDDTDLAPGVYVLRVEAEWGVRSLRVVKE